jgi:hypothetical protein
MKYFNYFFIQNLLGSISSGYKFLAPSVQKKNPNKNNYIIIRREILQNKLTKQYKHKKYFKLVDITIVASYKILIKNKQIEKSYHCSIN